MRKLLALALLLAGACSPSEEGRLKAEAEESVRRQLRDPDSARFSYGPIPFVFPEQGLVCGEVNARNGFGGYTGNQMFAYSRGTVVALSEGNMAQFTSIHDRCLAAMRRRTQETTDRTNRLLENSPELKNRLERQQ